MMKQKMLMALALAVGFAGNVLAGTELTGETFVTDYNVELSDSYSGNGGFHFLAAVTNETQTFSGYVTSDGVRLANVDYRDVNLVSGLIGGPNFAAALKGTAWPTNCHQKLDVVNKEFSVQFQALDGTTVKAVRVRVKQDGTDAVVYAKSDDAGYKSGATLGDFDLDSVGKEKLATSDTEGSYGIKDLVVGITGGTAAVRTTDGTLQSTDTSLTIPNAHFRQVALVSGRTAGGSMNGNLTYSFFNRKEYESYATVQAQVKEGNYVKCLLLKLEPSGTSVLVKLQKTWHDKQQGVALGTDFETASGLECQWNGSGTSGYALCELGYRLDATRQKPQATLSGVNTYSGETLIDGTKLTLGGTWQVLPSAARVVVTNGGELVLNATVESGAGGDNAEMGIGGCNDKGKGISIDVSATSVLRVSSKWNVAEETKIVIDGGRLVPEKGATYFHDLTLMNGAVVEGGAASGGLFRLADADLRVSGSSTSEVAADFYVYRTSATDNLRVTIDEGATLLVSGQALPAVDGESYYGRRILKQGAGTLVLRGAQTHTSTNEVLAGVVRLDASQVWSGTAPLLMDGGTLVCGAGTTNVVPSLAVGAKGGTILFEEGAMLEIQGYGVMSEGATLVVKGEVGMQTVKSASFPARAKEVLRYEAKDGTRSRFYRSSDGFLSTKPFGMVLIVR